MVRIGIEETPVTSSSKQLRFFVKTSDERGLDLARIDKPSTSGLARCGMLKRHEQFQDARYLYFHRCVLLSLSQQPPRTVYR